MSPEAPGDLATSLRGRNESRSVAVTGMGVVSALGVGVSRFWHGLRTGRSGIAPVTRFDTARFRCRLAGECDEAAIRLPDGPFQFEIARSSLFVRLALHAAQQALADADCGVDEGQFVPHLPGRGRIYLGVAMGGLPNIEAGVLRQESRGVRKTFPFLIPSLIPNMAASMIALRHGLPGEQHTIAGACASGAQALGEAMRAVARGDCDWALAGGAEAVTTPITYSGFEAMSAVSLCRDGEAAPKPFDARRDGFIPGEGAAIFLIETLDHARSRGRNAYGLIRGYATNSGSEALTDISREMSAACMKEALDDAGARAEEVDLVLAQASGNPNGDAEEAVALTDVFGGSPRFAPAATPPVTSIKGHTGYAFAANGPIGAIAAFSAMRAGEAPAVRNLDAPDPRCAQVDILRRPRALPVNMALVNAFGFGGVNASLILQAAP